MRVLVTGGSGFIGSHVVDKLRLRGHEPVIYDLRPSPWHEPGTVDTVLGSITDREPLERWSVGHITLLGDACHPMYPFMGQGAAQAIEDGATLAACLVAGDPAAGLRRYEELRRPRVTRLQEMSRANKIRFHLPDGPAQESRDAEWARAGDRSPEALRWLFEFDATVVPGR